MGMMTERLDNMQGPVRSYRAEAIDVRRDPDFIGDEWYDTHGEVGLRIKELFDLGWKYLPNRGLTIDNGDGPIVARPIKVMGQKEYTGIGYWHDRDFSET